MNELRRKEELIYLKHSMAMKKLLSLYQNIFGVFRNVCKKRSYLVGRSLLNSLISNFYPH